MAAEIPVDLAKEDPQVEETLLKIGKYVAGLRQVETLKAGEIIIVASKVVEVGRLNWYRPGDAFVLTLSYPLSREQWESWAECSYLKCHYDEDGNLNGVYNLL